MRNYVNLAVPTMPLLVADKRGAAETKIIANTADKECQQLVTPWIDPHDLSRQVIISDRDEGSACLRSDYVSSQECRQTGDYHNHVEVGGFGLEHKTK